MPEEQPIAPGRSARHTFVQERAERRDAGAGADHDDRYRRIGGKAEMLSFLDIDVDRVAGTQPFAEKCGRDAEAGAAVDRIANGVDA